MLSTLKNLNNRLQKCVGGAKLQANGGALVGATNTMLQARVSGFVQRHDNGDITHIDKSSITKEALIDGLLNYSIMPCYDHQDECELTQQLLSDGSVNPMVYVGTQDPQYYGVYDGAYLRRYHETLLRDGHALIDPRTRLPITNIHNTYNAANYRPAYVSGTTNCPSPPTHEALQPPPVYHHPFRNGGAPVTDVITIEQLTWTSILRGNYTQANAAMRYDSNVNNRVRYAIQHFFLEDPPDDGGSTPVRNGESYMLQTDTIANRYVGVIDLLGLHARFQFGGDEPPTRVDNAVFRGFPGLENYGIIFMRDRPYNHNFQNQRLVMDHDMYIDFFVFVLQAYFYTGLTQQRIRVIYNYVSCTNYLLVPYVYSVTPFETRIVIFEVELQNYMDDSQRWLLRIVTSVPGDEFERDEVNARQPEFDDEGNRRTFRQAYLAAQRRMMDEAASQRALNEMIGAARSSRGAGRIGNSGSLVESRSGSANSSQDAPDPS